MSPVAANIFQSRYSLGVRELLLLGQQIHRPRTLFSLHTTNCELSTLSRTCKRFFASVSKAVHFKTYQDGIPQVELGGCSYRYLRRCGSSSFPPPAGEDRGRECTSCATVDSAPRGIASCCHPPRPSSGLKYVLHGVGARQTDGKFVFFCVAWCAEVTVPILLSVSV